MIKIQHWIKNKVCEVFIDLIIQKSDSIIERNPRFQEFIEYITVTLIEDSIFPTDLWNHWNNMQASRTNNNNEAYNHRLDTRLNGKNHPNIWSFIEIIKTEESLMNVYYERVIAGTMKRRDRKTRDVESDLAITNAYRIYFRKCKNYSLRRFSFTNS